jgi:hypothetical protein
MNGTLMTEYEYRIMWRHKHPTGSWKPLNNARVYQNLSTAKGIVSSQREDSKIFKIQRRPKTDWEDLDV